MIYINGKYQNQETETVDQFETRKEAKEMIKEYRIAYGPEWSLWLSQRSTNDWRKKE